MEREAYERPSVKTLLLVEDHVATASQLGGRLAGQAGYQVIVTSDCVTALRIPALVQTGSHAGGCSAAHAQWH